MANPSPPRPAPFRLTRWLALGNVLLALALAGLAVLWRSESAEDERSRAREAVIGTARALAQGVTDDIVRVDGVLRSAVAAFERAPGEGLAADGSLAEVLPDLRAGLTDADVLLVCDAGGNVRLGLPEKSRRPVNLADRDFFVAARAAAPEALPIVSKPWISPVSGRWGITIARPLRAPDGAFAGTVHAVLGSAYFARRLAGMPLGPEGAVALRTADLTLIARVTRDGVSNEGLGSTATSASLAAAVAKEPAGGHLVSRSPSDGVLRAVAYQRVTGFPLYVVVGQGTGDAFGDGVGSGGR